MLESKQCVDLERLRAAYQMWNDTKGQSVQTWLDLMADDVKMDSLAEGRHGMEFTKSLTGKEQAATYFADLREMWEMNFFRVDEFIVQGDRVAMLGRCSFRSRLTGKTAESAKADILRFRAGLIVEYFDFFDTAKAYAAATP